MDTLSRIKEIKGYHHYYNRWVTFAVGLFIAAVFLGLWWFNVELLDQYKSLTGLAMIALAVVFYQLPYFAYLLNRRRYRQCPESMEIMGKNWKAYRSRIMMRL